MKEKDYIVFSVKYDSLSFEYRAVSDEVKYADTNEIFEGCLFYTHKYFKKNIDSVIQSISKLEITYVKSMLVEKAVIFDYIKVIMEKLKLEELRLTFLTTISAEDFDILLSINGLKIIDTYYMPNFIKNKFEGTGTKVILHNSYKFSDKFTFSQNCFDSDALYYKKELEITQIYDTLLNDIEEFLRINIYLKGIYIRCFDKALIENIIELVKKDESKNIIIFLHQEDDKGGFINSNFKWLKEINKKCKKEEICEFRIVYSNSFVSGNLFKQLTFNNLKLISILGIYVCVVAFIISKSYAYVEELNVNKLSQEIINNPDAEVEETLPDEDTVDEAVTEEEIRDKYSFDAVFSNLKKINKDTVGFLTVNNTNISYPVVQSRDNNYYLTRDFYKKKTSMGWIYMDYRNNPKDMNDNTIIYGHSMKNGTMFGTLKKTLNSSWRKDETNMIITYEIEEETRYYKIFSVYKVDYTTDYLKTSFDSKSSFDSFVQMIKKRSVYKSKEKVEYGDKILTLSTCTGTNNKRLVVHAVLMNE